MPTVSAKGPTNVRGSSAVAEPTKPTNPPPGLEVTAGVSIEAQPEMSESDVLALLNTITTTAEPELGPPGVKEAVRGAAATVWVNNVVVNALWSINQNRNSWAAFAGNGWQKFANNSDSAIIAFTTLAAHARVAQGPTSYRQEADNMVHELYVW
jgi:hypothetical protein